MGYEAYVVVMSDDFMKALELTPRDKWKIKYRSERMERKGYKPKPTPQGEIGRIQSIVFRE